MPESISLKQSQVPIPKGHSLSKFLIGATAYKMDKYYYLYRNENNELFSFLDKKGMKVFHSESNKGDMYSLHQIIAFFFCGGRKAHLRGSICIQHYQEIHHLNGNTFDNRPINLCYVTSAMHKHITKMQRGIFKVVKHKWLDLSDDETPIWNKQGKRVLDIHAYTARLIALTILSTNQWVHNCKGYLIDVVHFIDKIYNRLLSSIDITFVPNAVFIPFAEG